MISTIEKAVGLGVVGWYISEKCYELGNLVISTKVRFEQCFEGW